MNYVLQFLKDNCQRLDLVKYGWQERMTSVVLTPRFRASSHVVFLVLPQGQPDPVLVAKTPRLLDSVLSLEREANNLRYVQGLKPEGFVSIPRVLAFEEYCGRPILVESALIGKPMDPPEMRRNFDACCAAAMDCLTELNCSSDKVDSGSIESSQRRIANLFDYLTEMVPWNSEERRALDWTRERLEPLSKFQLPVVLEHGDFSHPNVMLLPDGRAAVVDWEMADPHGLPCHDLIFFLTYATFARHNANENGQYLPAIRAAFFGKSAWACRYVLQYARQLQLPLETLTPLFLLCWVRYLGGLLNRLDETGGMIRNETADWLRQNRYYAAWRYTLDHVDELHWTGA